jgi:hypothetical protein
MGGDWRDRFEYAWQAGPRTRRGPRSDLAATHPRHWSGTRNSKFLGTVTLDPEGWVAYLRLEDPPGLSPIMTVGRYDSAEEAQVATDAVWVSR